MAYNVSRGRPHSGGLVRKKSPCLIIVWNQPPFHMKMAAPETICVCNPEVTDSVQNFGHAVQSGRSILICWRNCCIRIQGTYYCHSLKVEAIYFSETVAPTKLHGVTLYMRAIFTVSAILSSGLHSVLLRRKLRAPPMGTYLPNYTAAQTVLSTCIRVSLRSDSHNGS